LKALPLQLRGVPLSTYDAFEELEILREIDPYVPGAYDSAALQSLDLMIGTAFHAVIFAIQAGVPVIAISYAAKVERLMKELGLAEYVLQTNEWHKLPALVAHVIAHRDEITARLHEITAQLSQAIQQIMQEVRHMVELAPSRPANSPCVSIVLLGSDSDEATGLTLEACLQQTYSNTEVIVVSANQRQGNGATVLHVDCAETASLAQRVNLGLRRAGGEYVTSDQGR
jgi:hypothetical protein